MMFVQQRPDLAHKPEHGRYRLRENFADKCFQGCIERWRWITNFFYHRENIFCARYFLPFALLRQRDSLTPLGATIYCAGWLTH